MTAFTHEPYPWADSAAPMREATPEEQRAAALAADGELTLAGIPSLPTGAEYTLPRGTNMAGGDNGQIEGVSPAHTVDATKSAYDLAPGPIAPNTRNMDMRKPVTAEEAQQKATVLADYLDRPMPDGPQRADYIAQM